MGSNPGAVKGCFVTQILSKKFYNCLPILEYSLPTDILGETRKFKMFKSFLSACSIESIKLSMVSSAGGSHPRKNYLTISSSAKVSVADKLSRLLAFENFSGKNLEP